MRVHTLRVAHAFELALFAAHEHITLLEDFENGRTTVRIDPCVEIIDLEAHILDELLLPVKSEFLILGNVPRESAGLPVGDKFEQVSLEIRPSSDRG